jgi:hypothetical protein
MQGFAGQAAPSMFAYQQQQMQQMAMGAATGSAGHLGGSGLGGMVVPTQLHPSTNISSAMQPDHTISAQQQGLNYANTLATNGVVSGVGGLATGLGVQPPTQPPQQFQVPMQGFAGQAAPSMFAYQQQHENGFVGMSHQQMRFDPAARYY